MFVVASDVANEHRLYKWADKSEFPAMWARATCGGGPWGRQIVYDDVDGLTQENVEGSIDTARSLVFYAKDKQTLRDGLKACAPSAKIKARSSQIGIYCGSYDFEGAAAWGATKIAAMQDWAALKKTGEADKFKEQGLGKSDYMKHKDRLRLLKRGHFALVAINTQMSRMDGVVHTHSAEMMLRTLGHWVS